MSPGLAWFVTEVMTPAAILVFALLWARLAAWVFSSAHK